MKTKEEILTDKYVMNSSRGEIVFSNETPKECAKQIINLIENRQRIIFDYGDIKTNQSWNEDCDICGYIGLSKGYYALKYPILVYNQRSTGGGSILTDCILSIKTSKGKKLIYQNKVTV